MLTACTFFLDPPIHCNMPDKNEFFSAQCDRDAKYFLPPHSTIRVLTAVVTDSSIPNSIASISKLRVQVEVRKLEHRTGALNLVTKTGKATKTKGDLV